GDQRGGGDREERGGPGLVGGEQEQAAPEQGMAPARPAGVEGEGEQAQQGQQRQGQPPGGQAGGRLPVVAGEAGQHQRLPQRVTRQRRGGLRQAQGAGQRQPADVVGRQQAGGEAAQHQQAQVAPGPRRAGLSRSSRAHHQHGGRPEQEPVVEVGPQR